VRDETVARNYAEALFDLARREGQLEEYGAAMESVARVFAENPDAKLFLETPRIDAKDKKRVLKEVFGDAVPRHVLNFLRVTVDKRRQRLLGEITSAYHDLLDRHLGRTHVEVTVARPYGEQDVEELTGMLSAMLDTQAVPHVRVKPEILGGIVLRAGDTVYDGSLRRRLSGMRRSLLTAHLPEVSHESAPDAG